MRFYYESPPPDAVRPYALLVPSDWDDWFTWETLHGLSYIDSKGKRTRIGGVKIASASDENFKGKKPALPSSFSKLGVDFFSLGQDDSYYSTLIGLPGDTGIEVLRSLNDVVFDESRLASALNLDVMTRSLMREVSMASIEGQFRKILTGTSLEHGKTAFDVSFVEAELRDGATRSEIRFKVDPESLPPSNVHVLIGRNGSGKTRLLQRMARSLITEQKQWGRWESSESDGKSLPSGVGLLSFSAFDSNPPLEEYRKNPEYREKNFFEAGLKRSIVGNGKDAEGTLWEYPSDDFNIELKSDDAIAADMAEALYLCTWKARDRWLRAVAVLESDPIFRSYDTANFIEHKVEKLSDREGYALRPDAAGIWKRMSSGHKIALLTVTELVARLEERTVVLFDEPEGHLHPPLLSALVRAISQVLVEKNAFAVIATHSPVVLQEVPRDCVTRVLYTPGGTFFAEPGTETFGEGIASLTRDVFGLEVDAAGFHQLIDRILIDNPGITVTEIKKRFAWKLGSEALAQIYANAVLDEAALVKDERF